MYKLFSKKKFKQKGFSLVELLVVVSIFLIISSITLFRQSKFSSDILITNTAYEVALAIREAQTYGVGSKQGGSSPSDRKKSFGVSFSTSNSRFILYSESPSLSGSFQSMFNSLEASYSMVSEINLPREQKILDICAVRGADLKCMSTGDFGQLDIAFVKPSLNAIISGLDGASIIRYDEAKIIVQSSLGDKCRTVTINTVGQISVIPVSTGATGCESL